MVIKLINWRIFCSCVVSAGSCACLACVLKVLDLEVPEWEGFLERNLGDPTAWGAITFIMGFLVVFRTSQAYTRFWEGCSLVYSMMGQWFDAASTLTAFCRQSEAPIKEKAEFEHMMVRLLSMLNALILAELENSEGCTLERAFSFELVDAQGVDRESLQMIRTVPRKSELVFQWIQSLIMEATRSGVLDASAPLVAQVFQDLSIGMQHFHSAKKIAKVFFPPPYAACVHLMLLLHWCISPLVMASWTDSIPFCGVFTFSQVFFFWYLNAIASELENPFDGDADDINVEAMQREMNESLVLLMRSYTYHKPHLTSATLFEADAIARTMSHQCFRSVWEGRHFSSTSLSDEVPRPPMPSEENHAEVDERPSVYSIESTGSISSWRVSQADVNEEARRRSPHSAVKGSKLSAARIHGDCRIMLNAADAAEKKLNAGAKSASDGLSLSTPSLLLPSGKACGPRAPAPAASQATRPSLPGSNVDVAGAAPAAAATGAGLPP